VLSLLPSTVDEKPHCGDRHNCSSGTYRLASSMRAFEVVLALQRAALGGHQSEHHHLAGRNEPQRREATGALVVVLQEETVDGELREIVSCSVIGAYTCRAAEAKVNIPRSL
jgi:hypothetical protein